MGGKTLSYKDCVVGGRPAQPRDIQVITVSLKSSPFRKFGTSLVDQRLCIHEVVMPSYRFPRGVRSNNTHRVISSLLWSVATLGRKSLLYVCSTTSLALALHFGWRTTDRIEGRHQVSRLTTRAIISASQEKTVAVRPVTDRGLSNQWMSWSHMTLCL